jgi:ATP/maltotriose-dependent transcriptional regulator MalT
MDVALASSGSAVASTKLHVPDLRAGVRGSCAPLAGRLAAARGPGLAVATGAATPVLATWAQDPADDRPFAWLSLDGADADPVVFWRGVIAALRTAHPGFGAEAERLLRGGPALLMPAVVPLVAAEAAALDRPTVLILAGFEAVAGAPAVAATVDLLLARRAPALLVAVGHAGPAPVGLDLGWLRAEGLLAELDAGSAAAVPRGGDDPTAALRPPPGAEVARRWPAALARGEHATVLSWLDALPAQDEITERDLWLVRVWAALEADQPGAARGHLAAADGAVPPAIRARGLLLDGLAAFRRGDLVAMAQSIDLATALDPADAFWHTTEALLCGLEAFWRGHPRVAHRHFTRAAGLAELHGDRLALASATGYLALIAAEGGDRDATRRRLGRLEDLHDADPLTDAHVAGWPGAMAEGRMLQLAGVHEGAVAPLERALALAQRGGSRLEHAEPLLRLAAAHRACLRPALAEALDAEARDLLASCPDHGRLAGPAAAVAPPAARRDVLSPSELSVLQLLPSGLSQREIGVELFLSVNTVKTHCRNIYTKLRAGSREQAVARARQRGLL